MMARPDPIRGRMLDTAIAAYQRVNEECALAHSQNQAMNLQVDALREERNRLRSRVAELETQLRAVKSGATL